MSPAISRRRLLSVAPAAAIAAAATPRGQAVAATDGDFVRLMSNTVAIFAGTAESNARPEVADKLAGIDRTASKRLASMDTAGKGELFSGVPLGTSDSNLYRSYEYLYQIALATRMPGGDRAGDVDVQRKVIDGLGWVYDHYFSDQSEGYYGNWWNWEIGIPRYVSRTLVLLADELGRYKPVLSKKYVQSMDGYLRHGKDGDVDLDSRFHTGANLADITTNRVLQGAATGDQPRVRKAISDQMTVFATIDPYHLRHDVTDGYYADGSFIQHGSVAYTGSYGKGLLTRVVQTIKILDGTSYAGGGDLVGVVQGWVEQGFAPLIFEGWMMEIVKGRAVSRTKTGYADVTEVVEAVVDLSGYATGADATALKGYVKSVQATSRASLDPDGFVSPVTIVRYTKILHNPAIPAKDLNPARSSVAFNAMDRDVHRRPGYAFALARSSDRISKYEYMSGENLMPWFQGDGAYYLYLSGQDQTEAFGVDYYTTVSPYRLAGVTSPVEHRKTIPELYGKLYYDNPDHPLHFTASSESQNKYVYFPRGTNTFSGGATLGAYGAAGMVQSNDVAYRDKQAGLLPDDFVVYRNADATKSWFMLDDEIVVLAAGVGDGAGRAVVTTVDSRIAGASGKVTLVGARRDRRAWSGAGSAELSWLRYANESDGTAVGYLFLDGGPVHVGLDRLTRSRRVVRVSNPDTDVTKTVFGVSFEQPAGAKHTALAYALVPNASTDQLRSYDNGPLTVVRNNPRVQAIRHERLGLIAANVFADSEQHASKLSIDGPASVLVRERRRGKVTVAVSDPTMNRDRVSVIVRGRPLRLVDADEGVRVTRVPGGTRVEATTRHAYGRSFTATLRPR